MHTRCSRRQWRTFRVRLSTVVLVGGVFALGACGGDRPPDLERTAAGKADDTTKKGGCSVDLTWVADPVIDAYAYLLDTLLTTDKPAIAISRHQATGCLDLASSAAARSALTKAVIDESFPPGDIRQIVRASPIRAGGASFLHWLEHASSSLQEAAEDAARDPLDPGEERLFGLRTLLERELRALASRGAPMELPIATDGEECSEFVVGLFDPGDETVVIIQIYPMC